MRAGWSAITLGVAFMASSGLVFITSSPFIARLFFSRPECDRVGASLLVVAAAFSCSMASRRSYRLCAHWRHGNPMLATWCYGLENPLLRALFQTGGARWASGSAYASV